MPNLPDFINLDGKQIPILEFMLMPCQTKEALHRWIELFLNIDLPDYTVSQDSNCNPMDMIWWLYSKSVLEFNKAQSRAIFVGSRSGYKTLGMSIAELLSVMHGNRDVCHIGAIKAQATRCYEYFTRFLYNPLFKQLLKSEPTISRTEFKNEKKVEIIPCTLSQVNGPHSNFVVLDEIETVQDMDAYRDISGIPTQSLDGNAPVRVGISSLKSAFGLMQKEIDHAANTGTLVFKWGLIDLTKKCPDERSGTEQIPIYVYLDTLEALSEEAWKKRTPAEQAKFEKRAGFKGCLQNCKMFSACLGDLKKQKCTSGLLKDIEYTQDEILSKPLDYTISQLLSRKPATEGLMYSRYSSDDHVKTYNEMWEIFFGEPAKKEITFDELRVEFEKRGIYPIMGVDFGNVAIALLMYVDGKNRVYVCKERMFLEGDDAEMALWLWTNWGIQYNVQMVYPDIENPSGIRLLKKQGFICSDKVDKDIIGGVGTVRSFLRIPGTSQPRLFIHDSCGNLIWEMPRYHKRKLPDGTFSEKPEDPQPDHSCDSLRYPLHTKFGPMLNMIMMIGPDRSNNPLMGSDNKHLRAPTAEEVAIEAGIQVVPVMPAGTITVSEPGKEEDKMKDPRSGGGEGFNWSF